MTLKPDKYYGVIELRNRLRIAAVDLLRLIAKLHIPFSFKNDEMVFKGIDIMNILKK